MTTRLWTPPKGIITPKLPSYVKLDMAFALGTGTTLFDKSRYRSHGTISGASWATGHHGYALDFNPATPSWVEIAAAYTQLDFTSEDFSIIVRCYIDDLTSDRKLLMRGTRDVGGYEWEAASNGRLAFRTSQLGANQVSRAAVGSIASGAWYTIGISRDGAAISFFANGVDVTDIQGTHVDPASISAKAYLGIYSNESSNPFDGKMEFYRIFGGIALPVATHLAWHNALA